MIEDKKIEEAARYYCNNRYPASQDAPFIAEGFRHGAKWAINELFKNLWHAIDENPKKYHKCLVEVVYHRPLNMTDEIDYVTSHLSNFGWDESSFKRSDYAIKRWIYIDDLLKGCNHD